MYEVILSPDAQRVYADADPVLARKLARCFERLEAEPRSGNNVKRLSGTWAGYLRYRVGDWRVIYRIDEPRAAVRVLVIAHRKEAYE